MDTRHTGMTDSPCLPVTQPQSPLSRALCQRQACLRGALPSYLHALGACVYDDKLWALDKVAFAVGAEAQSGEVTGLKLHSL